MNAADRGDRCIFEPEIGKLFDSTEEAFEYYNMYSWEVGFGIRFGRCRENKSGKRTMQDIVCACEGAGGSNDARTVRCQCKAMVRLLRQADDSWAVSRFVSQHTHPLARSDGERRKWKSHSRIDQMSRDLVMHLRGNNVQISRVCSIIGSMHGPAGYVPFSRQSMRSLCGRLAQESIHGDMEKTVEMFHSIRTADPGLVVKVDADEHGRIRSLFWAHGSGKTNYASFGDVVTFDTTYQTNLYNLPFGLFVGVNHHFQSVVFGAVLLTEETTEAFRWAFSAFLETMGSEPKTILTDQCQAMRNAIALEFPGARHRWCKWHVMKKAKESLGSIYSKNGSFRCKFHKLLDDLPTKEEFEERWASLVSEYGLEDNQFMGRAFEHRQMWAKPYFVDTFCAGMTSTQRSESANHMLKTYIPRAAPMHLFVSQYARLVANREADEGREDHATRQVTQQLRFGYPLEAHAASVYTRNMFSRFSHELFRSAAFICEPAPLAGNFRVSLINNAANNTEWRTEFSVHSGKDMTTFTCDCKLFDHVGVPCRHVLKVLVHFGVPKMPSSLLLKRWTIHAKDGTSTDEAIGSNRAGPDLAALHSILYNSAMELVTMCRSSRQAFEVALTFVSKGKAAVSSMTVMPPAQEKSGDNTEDQISTEADGDGNCDLDKLSAPPCVRSRGRPAQSRLKSPIESPGATTRKRKPTCNRASDDVFEEHGTEEQAATRSGKRKCHLCGQKGHYQSTCGRKSTYTPK
ncbi:unnamed protein product [Urochloa decumbens]|uniref:Protein FAR1-RELATED SEQUENCE n=1 Tax=Urochloa decumbens TaxID=240449 RepID=A0ABC8Y0Z6_9POAL